MNDASRRIERQDIQPAGDTQRNIDSAIIPSSFWLGGLKIEVEYDRNLVKNRQMIGEARYGEQRIILDPSAAPLQTLEQSFLHELTHWIFFIMGEEELRSNERIVDLFAHFLYQARVSARHDSLEDVNFREYEE